MIAPVYTAWQEKWLSCLRGASWPVLFYAMYLCHATLSGPCCAICAVLWHDVCAWDTPPTPRYCEWDSVISWIAVTGQQREDKDLNSSVHCTAAGRQFNSLRLSVFSDTKFYMRRWRKLIKLKQSIEGGQKIHFVFAISVQALFWTNRGLFAR